MKKLTGRKLAAVGLAAAIVISGVVVPDQADAAKKTVKKVTVNKKKVTLYKGAAANYGSIRITAKISPKKAAKTKLKWKSSKKKVATVNAKGLIKAKKAGKATITVTAGKKSAKIKVTVKTIKKKVSKVSVANKNVRLVRGKTSKIKTTVAPKKATLKKVVYSSGNSKIATVSASGVIKGVKAGKTTITVKAVDGSKKQAKVSVQVVNPAQTVTKPPVKPATPSSDPTTPPSDPTTPPVEPTEPPVEPTKPPVEPTEPPVEPTTPPVEPTPTTEPFQTKVSGEKDMAYANNTKYVLDAETTYLSKATVDGREYEVKINDATIDLANRVLARMAQGEKTLSVAYERFVERARNVSYQVAEGVTITVTKAAGANQATAKVVCAYEDIAGEYTLRMAKADSGYAVSLEKADGSNKISAVIVQPDGNKTEYQVSDLVIVRNGKPVRQTQLAGKVVQVILTEDGEITTVKAVSGTYRMTLTYNRTTEESIFEAQNVTDTIKAAYDGSTGKYSISIPDRYIEKYRITLFQ